VEQAVWIKVGGEFEKMCAASASASSSGPVPPEDQNPKASQQAQGGATAPARRDEFLQNVLHTKYEQKFVSWNCG